MWTWIRPGLVHSMVRGCLQFHHRVRGGVEGILVRVLYAAVIPLFRRPLYRDWSLEWKARWSGELVPEGSSCLWRLGSVGVVEGLVRGAGHIV